MLPPLPVRDLYPHGVMARWRRVDLPDVGLTVDCRHGTGALVPTPAELGPVLVIRGIEYCVGTCRECGDVLWGCRSLKVLGEGSLEGNP